MSNDSSSLTRPHVSASPGLGLHCAEDASTQLHRHIAHLITEAGGWLGFDRFMAAALYAPGLGYYARGSAQFGAFPAGHYGPQDPGSDFVTAPELSPVFGQLLAVQVAQALERTGTQEIWEFGAGTGALAQQLLQALQERGLSVQRYTIVDLSGSLRERQRQTLAGFAPLVHWADSLPERMQGVVVGNEVLDAMPVQLLARRAGVWHERGVILAQMPQGVAVPTGEHELRPVFLWSDRPSDLRPPLDVAGGHDYVTEIHPQAAAFIRTLGDRLERGAAFFIDYGFPEAEYYHPQRDSGTLVCHRQHRMDDDVLSDVGAKDITAHVNFTDIAVAAQDSGFELLGYTSQAHFLINCGLAERLQTLPLGARAQAARLMMEHEMGEIFKVIALSRGCPSWQACGFMHGDRTHRL